MPLNVSIAALHLPSFRHNRGAGHIGEQTHGINFDMRGIMWPVYDGDSYRGGPRMTMKRTRRDMHVMRRVSGG